jgi:hypothetical protein
LGFRIERIVFYDLRPQPRAARDIRSNTLSGLRCLLERQRPDVLLLEDMTDGTTRPATSEFGNSTQRPRRLPSG